MAEPGRYILMIENDKDDRYITEATIKELGLDVRLKFSLYSDDLLSEFERTGYPSMILLGYHTFPKQGIPIVKKIRSHESTSHIPVVVLSEDISTQSVHDYYRAGANTVVKKPWSFESTRNKIQTFFSYWLDVAAL